VVEQLFLHGVPIEAGNGADPSGDCCPRSAPGFHVPAEAFDISRPRLERAQTVLLTPRHVLAQIQRIRVAGQTAVAGEEPRQRGPLSDHESGSDRTISPELR